MKDRKYDKHHIWSKNHSGCLETSCHVRGPLRNKMTMLGVIPSRSDIDPSAKLEFYSLVHFVLFIGSCSFMAEEVENTGKHKIDNRRDI